MTRTRRRTCFAPNAVFFVFSPSTNDESEHSFHLSDAAITLRAIELLRRDALTSESLNHLPCDMLSAGFSTSGAAAGLWEEQCLRMTKPPVNLTWSTTVDGLECQCEGREASVL